jgi:DNA-binding response OmpR family regulator
MIPRIVIIEDNVELLNFLKELVSSSLEADTHTFTSGVEGLKYIISNKPNLVIVDLFLEDLHGKTITESIRKTFTDVPIIILTGDKTSESLIASLKAGADDYITKPFNSEELIARIHSKIRNLLGKSSGSELKSRDLVINTETMEVKKGGKLIELTSKEFELLNYLMINKFRVCTRDKILFSVWGYSSDVDTRVVDVHIGKLRKKLGDENEEYIRSIRGYGYRLMDYGED